jgi:hypothetical protein
MSYCRGLNIAPRGANDRVEASRGTRDRGPTVAASRRTSIVNFQCASVQGPQRRLQGVETLPSDCYLIRKAVGPVFRVPEWWNLVDTRDLKSLGACPRDGSSPSSGTRSGISPLYRVSSSCRFQCACLHFLFLTNSRLALIRIQKGTHRGARAEP